MKWRVIITDEMRALDLNGNELLAYAIIDGYSANGQGCFYGSPAYLAELLTVSPRTVNNILAKLVDRGLIRREEYRGRGIHTTSYTTDVENRNAIFSDRNAKISNRNAKISNRNAKISDADYYSSNENNNYNNIINNTTRAKRASSSSEIIQKFIEAGCSADALRDWKAARKSKPITEAVLQGMQREAAKAGITLADAVRICAENGWQGFRAEYLERRKSSNAQPTAAKQSTFMDDLKRTADKLAAKWGAQ